MASTLLWHGERSDIRGRDEVRSTNSSSPFAFLVFTRFFWSRSSISSLALLLFVLRHLVPLRSLGERREKLDWRRLMYVLRICVEVCNTFALFEFFCSISSAVSVARKSLESFGFVKDREFYLFLPEIDEKNRFLGGPVVFRGWIWSLFFILLS